MEVILIHKPIGPVPAEMLKATVDNVKSLLGKPESVVPGGKLVGSYYALGQWLTVCIWDVPHIEALSPLLEQLRFLGMNTEVIPVERTEVAIEKIEKVLQAM
ncbi:MAG: hypothetical protein A2Y60_07135 [Chloroflexi bacterium RBG_13_54_9]|nr:MAG: hypothetical protein A2Y60_07135 [Chloroflexi bacterium RBG_13_54_9]